MGRWFGELTGCRSDQTLAHCDSQTSSTQFLGVMQVAGRRYVLGDEIEEVVQLFQISFTEARKNRGFVDLGELIQFIQNRLSGRS